MRDVLSRSAIRRFKLQTIKQCGCRLEHCDVELSLRARQSLLL